MKNTKCPERKRCFDYGDCASCERGNFILKLYRRIDRLKKQKEFAPRWISVSQPPETYRDEYGELIPFLVCCKGTVYPFRAVYDGMAWGDGVGKLKVTHWMPLPAPPLTEKCGSCKYAMPIKGSFKGVFGSYIECRNPNKVWKYNYSSRKQRTTPKCRYYERIEI